MAAKRSGWVAGALVGCALLAGCGARDGQTPSGVTTENAPAKQQTTTQVALITVPDVSGMNHQQAQDTMQAAGLYNLREVDGKGLGRALVVDNNWVQTGQSPAAGTKVAPDTVITLTAVKYTDK
ncbi:PASTA domain-containing protein [Amycolatopsis sp. NPDC059657]|uniref:PASTA domain-containing protein n=1 Tax=Amycolatopsis sp. NPDC059657 TaxID=3346899 RepID=UPI00366FFA51